MTATESDGAAALSPGARRRNLVAIVATMTVASLTYGMGFPLLSLVLANQGTSSELIGLNAAVPSVAVLLVAPFASRLMRAHGPALPVLVALPAMAVIYLLLPTFPNVYAWFPLRFLMGVAGSIMWITGEAWINQVAGDHQRGRVVALYSMAVAAGYALGPLVLTLVGSRGWTPFLIASALTALAALPSLLVLREAPKLGGRPSVGPLGYLRAAPAAMCIAGLYAAIDGMVLSFLPLYGIELGQSEVAMLALVTLLGIGGIVGQLPIGWLADRMDRRRLVISCTLALIVGALAIPAVLGARPWEWAHFLAFGAVLGGLYTLGMVQLGQRFKGADLASASAAFGFMWGLGMMAGPALGGFAMRAAGPHGLIGAILLLLAAFLPVAVWGWGKRSAGAPHRPYRDD
jgi:MFS family permease